MVMHIKRFLGIVAFALIMAVLAFVMLILASGSPAAALSSEEARDFGPVTARPAGDDAYHHTGRALHDKRIDPQLFEARNAPEATFHRVLDNDWSLFFTMQLEPMTDEPRINEGVAGLSLTW